MTMVFIFLFIMIPSNSFKEILKIKPLLSCVIVKLESSFVGF